MSNPPIRKSTRKRSIPKRYGFATNTIAKRRCQTNSLQLCDLPIEILRDHVFGFLCASSSRFGLQTTNKLFRNLSNTPEVLQPMKILHESEEYPSEESQSTLIRRNDTSSQVITRLLPFVKANNLDALLMMGKVAIYLEDDLEVGMALLQKGIDLGDLRCQHELANLLVRHRRFPDHKEHGKQLLASAAEAGHAPSQLCSLVYNRNRTFAQALRLAAAEMNSMECLKHLLRNKPDPPRPKWAGYGCSNPLCTRECYRVRRRRAREWLKTKEPTEYWNNVRESIRNCGIPTRFYCRETAFYVPDFHYCARCMEADYCGRACQVVHWQIHRRECQPAQQARNLV